MLHIITGLATGGAEGALYRLLKGGLASQFDSQVISLTDEGAMGARIRALGVPVTALYMRVPRFPLSALRTLRRLVRENQPDIIHGWMYHGNLVATLACRLVSGHSSLVWNVRHSLYDIADEKPVTRQVIRANRLFSASSDALLYNSMLSRQQHEDFGFSSRNAHVISTGIDVKKFRFSADSRDRVRLEVGIPAEAQVVGHVARLHPMKDHSLFLRAAASLAVRYPQAHFLLCGRNVTLQNTRLERLVPARVRDRFHLLGERGDVHRLMSAMDVFCQSSWSEAFPNVLGEAMATSIPCVATDVGDSAVVVGGTGVVVPARNEQALAAGIKHFLDMSLEVRRARGEAARIRIEINFPLAVIVKQYARLYSDLLYSKSREAS